MGWWVISGEAFREAMQRAQVGEDADLLYAEYYANSDVASAECHHEWLDRPESDTRECLICGVER